MPTNRFSTLVTVVVTSSMLLAGCSLPFLSKPETPTGPQGALDQAANAAKLSVMMATGQAGTCTIVNTTEADSSPMEIVVKGKKFRMKGNDFGGNSQNNPSESGANSNQVGYMLNDGEYLYFWQDQATTGMKMKLQPSITPGANNPAGSELNQADSSEIQDPVGLFESDEKYRIDCVLGNVSDEMVLPPATVNFTDFSQAMNFSGADKVPAVSIPAGKMPNIPEGMNYPNLPIDLPADSNDSGE